MTHVALFNFEPQATSEVAIKEGEEVTLIQPPEEGDWAYIENATGHLGYVPFSYLTPHAPPPAASAFRGSSPSSPIQYASSSPATATPPPATSARTPAAAAAASTPAASRDDLRFSTFVPLLEEQLTPEHGAGRGQQVDLGSFVEIQQKMERLLEIALLAGQEDRVQRLLALLSRLSQLEEQATSQYGADVPRDELRLSTQVPLFPPSSPSSSSSSSPAPPPSSFLPSSTPPSSSSSSPSSSISPSSSSSSPAATESEPPQPIDCPICFTDFMPADGRGLLGCTHLYCSTCLPAHFEHLINENAVADTDLVCPSPGCGVVASAFELEALVSAECFAKYQDFVALSTLRNDSHTKWCPNVHCAQPIAVEIDANDIECPACRTHFCARCNASPYHTGASCDESNAASKAASNDTLNSWMRSAGTRVKPCPACNDAIEKNAGCNHITCVRCNHQWCWLCRGPYDTPRYGHFNSGRCKGLQFSSFNSIEEVESARSKRKGFLALTILSAGLASPLYIYHRKKYSDLG